MAVKKKMRLSPDFIGFLQAIALLVYISAIGFLLLNGNKLFGPNLGVIGPVLFLSIFVFSAIFSASLIFAYPLYIIFAKKDWKTAFRIVGWSAATIFLFITSVIILSPFVK